MSSPSFLNTSHQTIGWFADLNQLGRLVIRPPFQRRPVWNDEEKSFLIDSILRGYPVPEIYVYSITTGPGEDKHAVVDGQQRLRACLEYMADGFPVSFDVHKLEPLYTLKDTPWYGLKYSQLTKDHKDLFRRYKLIVRDLEGVDESHIRHMFHRLNQSNVALNSQELRFSMYSGGFLKVVEKLVEREEWEHFRIFTKTQRRRMLDSEYLSELVIGHLHWPQNKKENLDHYYRQYASSFPFADEVLARFDEVLKSLVNLFPKPKMSGTRWYRKSDFYTLFLAITRGKLQLAAYNINELRERLTDFSIRVSNMGPSQNTNSPADVYRAAVERAATDRSRRVRREDALLAFLSGKESVGADAALVEKKENNEVDEVEDTSDTDEEYVDP
ncbi:DUF262 domain-containing protein [Pyxidicoccus sp. 3LFB2]